MRKLLLFLFITLLYSCYEGITPFDGERESYLKGKIIVTSGLDSWPKPDSAKELRIVVVPEFPPYNIIGDILEGRAFLSDTLARFVDTIPYEVKIQKTPMESAYILVSLRYGSIVEQRMIGFYKKLPESKIPDKLFIPKGVTIKDLDIFIDFYNLPEQKPIE